MQQLQRDTVYGWIRENCNGFIEDIIKIILQFYLIHMDSHILSTKQQMEFLDFLFDKF